MSRHIYRVVGADGSFWGWFDKRKQAAGHLAYLNSPPAWLASDPEYVAARPLRVQRTKVKWEDITGSVVAVHQEKGKW